MQLTVASKIPFSDFCNLCQKISLCPKPKKADCLQRFIGYFRNYAKTLKDSGADVDDSFYPVLRLLLPQLERERAAYGVKEHVLAKMFIRILCLPKQGPEAHKLLHFKAPHAASTQSADFADVAYLVLRSRCRQGTDHLTVEQVNTSLDKVAARHAAHDPRGMEDELRAVLVVMSAASQKWLVRVLLKDMRLGLGSKRVLTAFHPDAQDLYDVTNDLRKCCETLKDPARRLHEAEVQVFSPCRPMLAERCDVRRVEEAMRKGRVYFVETKHDGERFQLHMRDGLYKYFSRNGFDCTDTFGSCALVGQLTPHVARLLRPGVRSVILDGEMMGWDTRLKCYKTKGISFDVKSLRAGGALQPCYCVFDVLLLDGQVLTNRPLSERLAALRGLFAQEEGVLMHTERAEVATGARVAEELNTAIDRRLEGIILKDPASVYKPNARNAGWFKIKPEYTDGLMDHLDVIIMGGYYGDGKHRGIVSHFLVGLAVPSPVKGEDPREFWSLGRVGSGYTSDELADLLLKMSPHWRPVELGRCPPGLVWTRERPEVWIPPEKSVLLEVKATEIVRSNLFKVEYTLRFPRVEKIRYDKNWSECLTTAEFEDLRQKASGLLYSRHVDTDERAAASPRKKQQAREKPCLAESFRSCDLSGVSRRSGVLAGRQFCVMTGWRDLSKVQVEARIAEHGGSVTQNPGPDTHCVLADGTPLRVRNVLRSGRHDVARLGWLMGVLGGGAPELQGWEPADLLGARPATARALAARYDKYGDSYTRPAGRRSLVFPMGQVDKLGDAVEPSPADMAEFDIELFSDPSPWGTFRLCRAYFDKFASVNDPSSPEVCNMFSTEIDFMFYGGEVVSVVDERTTHVIFQPGEETRLAELRRLSAERAARLHLVCASWVEESVRSGRRLPERDHYPVA
ncbi:DNA ligase 4 [Bacillus rossius redtenbacheri]|uniref:DNA ligase 4 n=1 Tax=Bacillus rossius redtenbacheri TaxID=93214 RepID=UPI002FDD03C3